jgi:hypothetical protein
MAKVEPIPVTVKALRTVEHDGVSYGPGQEAGDTFDCTPVQAQALVSVEAVEVVGAEADAEVKPATKTAAKK